MTDILIEAKNITVEYSEMDRPALCDASLSIRKGERIGLVGASGSGKSTLLNVMAGILRMTKGTLHYTERWKNHLYRHLTLVVQHPREIFSPRQQMEDFLRQSLQNFDIAQKSEIPRLIRDVLAEVNLSEKCLTSYPHELSGGQLQRVVIARALLLEPDCILFDEPTSALDVLTQDAILKLVVKLQKIHHFAMIFVSHDLGVVQQMSDKTVVLSQGHMVEILPSFKVKNPIHPATSELVASELYQENEALISEPQVLTDDGGIREMRRKEIEQENHKNYVRAFKEIEKDHFVEIYTAR